MTSLHVLLLLAQQAPQAQGFLRVGFAWGSLAALGWIVFTIIGVITIACIHLLKPKRAGSTANCGQCGYATRGLDSFDCPECGADLREVGIVPPRTPTPFRTNLSRFLIVDMALLAVLIILFAIA